MLTWMYVILMFKKKKKQLFFCRYFQEICYTMEYTNLIMMYLICLAFKSNIGWEKWRENLDNLICQYNRHTRRLSQTTQMCESVHIECPPCLVLLQILLNEKCQDTMHQARGSLCQRMPKGWQSTEFLDWQEVLPP